jgi:hypothetical protein
VATLRSTRLWCHVNQRWTSTGPLVAPIQDTTHPIVSLKDPSVVYFNGRWHVFATTANTSGNIRDGNDQNLDIDPAHLQFLYQGVDPSQTNVEYSQLPYRLGLLTRAP